MADKIETKTEKKDTKKEDKKEAKFEREYVIPLRSQWLKVPQYRRSGRAIKAIKKFVAKHMKVEDRDVNKVKLDVYFNNEIWFRGRTNPPAKVKVKVTKEGENVKVTFVEIPEYVKFLQAKHEKFKKRFEKKEDKKETKETKEVKPEEKKEEKTEEQKKDEKEKEKSVAQTHELEAKQDAKIQKHMTKPDKAKTYPQRMALQK